MIVTPFSVTTSSPDFEPTTLPPPSTARSTTTLPDFIPDNIVSVTSFGAGRPNSFAVVITTSDCAMIFQQFNLVPRMDVVSNVLHGTLNHRSTLATMFNLYPMSDIHKAIDILDRLGIADHAPKRAEALSGGQQQRVAIARALMQDPKIILADEPIASLDPMNAQTVMEALRRIHEEDGRTVVANLHTLDTARRYCDRVVGMRDGRIVFDGLPEQLTTGVAREIYGAGADFSEAATSTAIETLEQTEAVRTAEAYV